jgi:hypothetical protein
MVSPDGTFKGEKINIKNRDFNIKDEQLLQRTIVLDDPRCA